LTFERAIVFADEPFEHLAFAIVITKRCIDARLDLADP